jgi:hypothetical protein
LCTHSNPYSKSPVSPLSCYSSASAPLPLFTLLQSATRSHTKPSALSAQSKASPKGQGNMMKELRKTSSALLHTVTKDALTATSKLTMMLASGISDLASDSAPAPERYVLTDPTVHYPTLYLCSTRYPAPSLQLSGLRSIFDRITFLLNPSISFSLHLYSHLISLHFV